MYRLIGRILALKWHPDQALDIGRTFQEETFDWPLFLESGDKHLVLPTLYGQLKRYGLTKYIREDCLDVMQQIFELNKQRNERILVEIDQITKALHERGIVPVFLKGACYLVEILYEDVGERYLGDIDLLVSDVHYLTAVEAIKQLGYEYPNEIFGDVTRMKHYPRMAADHAVAPVEIHRLPVVEKFSDWFNYEIISREMFAPTGRMDCRVPSIRHQVMLSFVHSQLCHADHQMGLFSFRNVSDLALLSHGNKFEPTTLPKRYLTKMNDYFSLVGELADLPYLKQPSGEDGFSWYRLHYRLNVRYKWLSKSILLFFQLGKKVKSVLSTLFHGFQDATARRMIKKRVSSRNWWKDQVAWLKELIR